MLFSYRSEIKDIGLANTLLSLALIGFQNTCSDRIEATNNTIGFGLSFLTVSN
jgi:hypothetical protein